MGSKTILSIFLILTLLLAGCAVQRQTTQGIQEKETEQETTTAPVTETQETKPVQVQPTKTTPEPADEETTTSSSTYNYEALPKEQQRKIKLVRNLLEEAKSKEENYFFRYTGPGVLQTDVWVKGDVVKRRVRRDPEIDKFNYYNMVFMYPKTQKAWGYCQTTKAKCWKGYGPFEEDYSKWMIKTPKDWVLELGDEFTWALDNKIADQLYHIVDFRKDGKTIRVYVNDYRGVPYRVDIYNRQTPIDSIPTGTADESYLYDDMDIGGVSDGDVTPPV